MSESKYDLSVIIPAYNESKNIASTLADVASYLNAASFSYEVIVVDDGSRDNTFEIANTSKELFKNFKVLKCPQNFGKGHAVKTGILSSEGSFVLFMDADNSTRINQLDKLLPQAKAGFEVVIASRRVAGAEIDIRQPLLRRILGNFYILLSRLILGVKVKDYNCGFKLFKSSAAKKLFNKVTRHDWSFDSEILFLANKFSLKIKEVPVKWQDVRTSKVKPIQDGIRSLFSLIKIRILDLQGKYI